MDSSLAHKHWICAGKLSTPGDLFVLILLKIPYTSDAEIGMPNKKLRLTTSVVNSLLSTKDLR